ncbi:uncharacterized protein DS421_7g215000 [Arachis hypogaea]|nr:uncharacterized protein DS421_7g215000 [Arachis hypogaea]
MDLTKEWLKMEKMKMNPRERLESLSLTILAPKLVVKALQNRQARVGVTESCANCDACAHVFFSDLRSSFTSQISERHSLVVANWSQIFSDLRYSFASQISERHSLVVANLLLRSQISNLTGLLHCFANCSFTPPSSLSPPMAPSHRCYKNKEEEGLGLWSVSLLILALLNDAIPPKCSTI